MDSANLEIIMVSLTPPPGIEQVIEDFEAAQSADRFKVVPEPPALGRQIDASGDEILSTDRETGPVPHEESVALAAVSDLTAGPARSVGRITAYFDGKVRWCTGTVVGEALILTAAHCVYQRATMSGAPARFADWMSFEPAYSNGESAGVWTGEKLFLQRGWLAPAPGTNPGPHDVALVRLDRAISQTTGIASLLDRAPTTGEVTAYGYPRKPSAGHDWDGERLYASTGLLLAEESEGTLKAQNGLTEGSSGGPWFVRVAGDWKLIGLNSMKPIDSDETTWSPALGSGFRSLLDAAVADTRPQ